MKKLIKAALPDKLLTSIQNIRKQARNFCGLAKGYGQWQTIRDWTSVDGQGKPIPWYSYPATEFLSHLELSSFHVFEYGSGNSTLWWASRAKQVTSVEDDETWHNRIIGKIPSRVGNIRYILEKDPERYCAMAANEHDIVIIDGRHRRKCLEHLDMIGWGGGNADFG